MVGIGLGKYLHQSSLSVAVLVGCHLQGWFSLIELPCNLPTVPCVFAGSALTLNGTNSQAPL